jgi:hypothetical protein
MPEAAGPSLVWAAISKGKFQTEEKVGPKEQNLECKFQTNLRMQLL